MVVYEQLCVSSVEFVLLPALTHKVEQASRPFLAESMDRCELRQQKVEKSSLLFLAETMDR
jgi:hypothetical protein